MRGEGKLLKPGKGRPESSPTQTLLLSVPFTSPVASGHRAQRYTLVSPYVQVKNEGLREGRLTKATGCGPGLEAKSPNL